MERRLAAILAADVVGFARLMSRDESATLATLKRCEASLIEPTVASHNGRIVKRMGDGFLVEFASAVDAVNCAIGWQTQALNSKETSLRFRIGINLGDIISEGGDIYGDGVNIAARLEALADAGGVCISSSIHEQIRRKTAVEFKDLGERYLKNIDGPVRMYGWALPNAGQEGLSGTDTHAAKSRDPNMLLVAAFRALGSDPTAEGLAEALTESIAVAMSHFDELTILDPGAVPFDADTRSAREIGSRLNVLYLLEGRVQAVSSRVRLSVQVLHVETGQRQWSESFDREVTDLFTLQDELTGIVAGTVGEALMDLMSKALDNKAESDWSARDYTIRGISHLHRFRHDQVLIARDYFQKALERNPMLPPAIICDCWTYLLELMRGWPLTRQDTVEYCQKRVEQLLARDERQSQAHRIMTRLCHLNGDHRDALIHAERAYELSPFDSDMLVNLGLTLSFTGEGKRGAELIERAIRTNPYAPEYYRELLATAYMAASRYSDALGVLERSVQLPRTALFVKIACLVHAGRSTEAAREMSAFLETQPDWTVERHARTLSFEEGPDLARFLEALRQAGLPPENEA